MPEYVFSLACILQYKDTILDSVHIQEYKDQEKPTVTIKNANFFMLIVSCLRTHQRKKKCNEKLTLKSSIQWYHMAECEVI